MLGRTLPRLRARGLVASRARSIWTQERRGALILLVSAAYGLVLALNIVTLLTPPRLSLQVAVPATGAARVTWVLPGSALWDGGVRAGARVLALDGRPPLPGDTGSWAGRSVRVRTTDGRVRAVTARSLQQGHDTWPLLLSSPWFLLLGTLVVLRASRPSVGYATYALGASAAWALALAPAADSVASVAVVAEFALVLLFATCFVAFFLTFPTPRGTVRQYALLLAGPLAASGLDLAALVWPALYDLAARLRLVILLVYLLLGAALVVYAYRTVAEREAGHGLTIITASTVVSILPFAVLYLAPTLLHRSPFLAPEHAILALPLFALGVAYAILRHNALDVPLLQRWLVHGLLWGGLFALCLAVVAAWRAAPLAALPDPGRTVVLAVLVLLVVGAAVGLHGRAWRLLDRLIFKDSYDYRASLQDLSRGLSLASDLDTLGVAVPATLRRLMNLDGAVLLIGDGEDMSVCGAAGTIQPALLVALAETADDVRDLPRPRVVALADTSVLVVPLRTHDAVVGYLCLGRKASGEPFRAVDHALLTTLSGHLTAIVRNVQLVGDLRTQVDTLEAQRAALDVLNERLQHVQEEERARLASDLHDEPLQTAIDLQRQIAVDGRHRAATAQHLVVSQTLVTQLRAFCTAMRPPALDDLGLHAALDQLTRSLGARAGVPILLDADPEVAELDLPPLVELTLYRATQEALNNCLRHARPRTVQVCLRRCARGVELRVADDGVGFAVPDRLVSLVMAGHLGLAGLHERVQHAGGRLRVTSTPGAGTMVHVTLPLQEAAPV